MENPVAGRRNVVVIRLPAIGEGRIGVPEHDAVGITGLVFLQLVADGQPLFAGLRLQPTVDDLRLLGVLDDLPTGVPPVEDDQHVLIGDAVRGDVGDPQIELSGPP